MRVRALTLRTKNPFGAGQRDTGHGRGLDRQGGQVLGLQAVDVPFSKRPGQKRGLHGAGVEEVGETLARILGMKTLFQLRLLRGDAHRAPSV